MSSIPLLEFRNLAFARDGKSIFTGLSAQLYAGDMMQIVGANGSGKTTLLGVISTALSASSGEVRWQGVAIDALASRYRASLLFVGHLSGVKGALTPVENLRWFSSLHRVRGDTSAADALRCAGLARTFQHAPCHRLSAGQQRRVALARLWLSAAPLWLLDEPLTAIDADGVGELEAAFARHSAAGGIVLFTSHQDSRLPGVKKLALGGQRGRD